MSGRVTDRDGLIQLGDGEKFLSCRGFGDSPFGHFRFQFFRFFSTKISIRSFVRHAKQRWTTKKNEVSLSWSVVVFPVPVDQRRDMRGKLTVVQSSWQEEKIPPDDTDSRQNDCDKWRQNSKAKLAGRPTVSSNHWLIWRWFVHIHWSVEHRDVFLLHSTRGEDRSADRRDSEVSLDSFQIYIVPVALRFPKLFPPAVAPLRCWRAPFSPTVRPLLGTSTRKTRSGYRWRERGASTDQRFVHLFHLFLIIEKLSFNFIAFSFGLQT